MLSLESSGERKKHVDRHLRGEKGLDPLVIDGYDAKELSLNQIQNTLIQKVGKAWFVAYQKRSSTIMSNKEKCRMCCFLGHMLCLETALEKYGDKPVVIMEDDVSIKFDPSVEITIPTNCDLFFLGGFHKVAKDEDWEPVVGMNKVIPKLVKYWCAHAYLVMKPSKFLKALKDHRPCCYDSYLNRYMMSQAYFNYPSLVVQTPSLPSQIDGSCPFHHLSF